MNNTNNSIDLSDFKARLTTLINADWGTKHTRLARAAGIAPSTIQGWVEKEKVNPNVMAVYKVAKACDVTVEWLLTGQDNYNKSNEPITEEQQETIKRLCEVLQVKEPHNLDSLIAYIKLMLRIADLTNDWRGGRIDSTSGDLPRRTTGPDRGVEKGKQKTETDDQKSGVIKIGNNQS